MTHLSQVSRRDLLKMLGAGVAGAGLLSLAPSSAQAQISPSTDDVVAYFRFKIGAFDAIIVSDNALAFPPANFNVQGDSEATEAFFAERRLVRDDGNVQVSVNNLIVNNGEQTILFDTGTGNRLLATLDVLGIGADGIDAVILSHSHFDHVNALSFDGTLSFPNATVYLPEPENTFIEEGPEGVVGTAVEKLAPAFEAGIVSLYNDGDEIVPGVSAVATPGHTPGHMAFLIESDDNQLIHFNDALPNAIANPANPNWVFGFDFDPETAIASRRAILSQAVESGVQVLGYHFTFPGLGYILPDGDNFSFMPSAF
ncbi:MAG: MBL fold metallo-hydrolase [Anaerolineae bacterium]